MGFLNKFYLLQYKNWKLQMRKKKTTVAEVLIPVSFCILMMAIRTLVEVNDNKEPTTYPEFSVNKFDSLLFEPTSLPIGKLRLGLAYTPKTNSTGAIMARLAARLQSADGPAFVSSE